MKSEIGNALRSTLNTLLLTFLIVLAFPVLAQAATITWTGTTSNNWNTTTNWDPNTKVPDFADDVIIKSGNYTITASGYAQCKTMTLRNGATVTLTQTAAGISIAGTTDISYGSLIAVNTTISCSGNVLVGGAASNQTGILELKPNTTLIFGNTTAYGLIVDKYGTLTAQGTSVALRNCRIKSIDTTRRGYILLKGGSKSLLKYCEIAYLGTDASDKYGISAGGINDPNGLTIQDNYIHHNYYGISLSGCANLNVISNTCSYNDCGIYLYKSFTNTLTGNNCSNNTYGVRLEYSYMNTLTANACLGNGETGIYSGSGADYNILDGNTCCGNGTAGIYFITSSANILTGNKCSESEVAGIALEGGSGNTLNGNTCATNTWYGFYGGCSLPFNLSNEIYYGNGDYHMAIAIEGNHEFSGCVFDNSATYDIFVSIGEGNVVTMTNFINDMPGSKDADLGVEGSTGEVVWIGEVPTIWTGEEDNYWSNENNWTEGVPNDLRDAYITETWNGPITLTGPASCKTLFLQTNSCVTLYGAGSSLNCGSVDITAADSLLVLASMTTLICYDNVLVGSATTNGALELQPGSTLLFSKSPNYGLIVDAGGTITAQGASATQRNCLITSIDETPRGYILLKSGSRGLFKYCEISCLGQNAAGKYGLSAETVNGNLTIEDNYLQYNFHGIVLSGCANLNVISNTCSDNSGAGIYLANSSAITLTSNDCSYNSSGIYLNSGFNNNLSGNTCLYNTAYGIGLASTLTNTLSGNTCLTNTTSGILLQTSSNNNILAGNTGSINLSSSSANTMTGNAGSISLSSSSANTMTGNAGPIYLAASFANTVISNTCSGNNNYGIQLNNSSTNTVISNTCSGNYGASYGKSGYGIYLHNQSYNNILSGNTCSQNFSYGGGPWDSGYGIYLSGVNNTISGNTCSGNSGDGIYLSSSSNNTLFGNTCSGNWYSIHLGSSSNNTVTGNTCLANTNSGIWFDASFANTLTGNNCSENSQHGVYLSNGSSNNSLSGNTCATNTGYGFYYTDSGVLGLNDEIYHGNTQGHMYVQGSGSWIFGGCSFDNSAQYDVYAIIGEGNRITITNYTIDHWPGSKDGELGYPGGSGTTGEVVWENMGETTWTGAAGDNDWFNENNWTDGLVPDWTIDAYITETWNGSITLTGPASCKNLFLQTNSCVTLYGGGTSLGCGSVSITATDSCLVIASNTILICAGDILVGNAATAGTLNLQPGSTLLFSNTTDYGLIVDAYGTLTATGTSAASRDCRIKSIDTNRRGYILLKSSAKGFFKYCEIAYLGQNVSGKYGFSAHSINGTLTIEDNYIHHNWYGIFLSGCSYLNVISNTCSNNYRGISLGASSANILTGNTCLTNTNFGMLLDSSSANILTGNTCSGNTNYGIYLNVSSDNILSGNTCSGPGQQYGIYLTFSSACTLTGNTCSTNTQYGFWVRGTTGNLQVSNEKYYGNQLRHMSIEIPGNRTFSGCSFDNSAQYDVYVVIGGGNMLNMTNYTIDHIPGSKDGELGVPGDTTGDIIWAALGNTTWTGAQDNNWSNEANWTDGVPNDQFDAYIDSDWNGPITLTPGAICRNLILRDSSCVTLYGNNNPLVIKGICYIMATNRHLTIAPNIAITCPGN